MQPLFAATWWFGRAAVNKAWRYWEKHFREDNDTPQLLMDSVEQGVIAIEMDRRVHSVGRGGSPNQAGIVELDAAWMEGNQLRAGGVAGMQDFLPAISVARRVMECTPHTLLVGKGAQQFAARQGFHRHRLLTPEAIRRWRQRKQQEAEGHDTVGVIGWHAGHVVVACSTSGTRWKLPGRVGDSPIVGAGLYADDQAGAAVATGLGEEIYRFSLTSRVVEAMRRGATAQGACDQAIRFMIQRKPETKNIMAAVIAVRKNGQFGSAATQRGFTAHIRHGQRVAERKS